MTSAKLGTYMNGHGLPADRITFVIVRNRPTGKPELIWPVFAYGHDQANAAVIGETLVFGAGLPDHQNVLMAHRAGEPPLVISPAVMRLAARRLGTSVVTPDTDCTFSKVRGLPGRIWLQAAKPGAYSYGEKLFAVQLTQDDLLKVIDETRQRGRLTKTAQVQYIAEPVSYSRIKAEDVPDAPKSLPVSSGLLPGRRDGTAYTPSRDCPYGKALVDRRTHFAYFSTYWEPGRILKVNLESKTNGGPAVVGALVLEPEEDKPFDCVIDEKNGYAYFATSFPGKIVKVALGNSTLPPSRIGSVLLDEQYNAGAGVIDPDAGYACFNVGQRLCKVKLGKGDEPPSIASSLTLTNDFRVDFVSSVLDPTSHCAYFGTDYKQIFKISLGMDDSPPRIIGVLTLPDDEQGLRGAQIDPQNGYAWFTSHDGYIVKIALGAADQPPIRLGSVKLDRRYQYLEYTFGMDRDGYGYYGTMSDETILKVALGKKEELPRLAARLRLPKSANYIQSFRTGVVDPEGRTLCLGVGSIDCVLMTLTLGEGDSSPRIVGETSLYTK